INKTQTKATPSGLSSPRTSSKGGPECHFSMVNNPVQARPENELTRTKAIYNKALLTLTKRVKKLEKELTYKRNRAVIHSLEDDEPSLDVEDSPKQGKMIEEIDKDENVNLVKSSEQGEAHETAEHRMNFSTVSPQKDDDDTTLAKTLLNIKRSAPK
ncbi:hypothetical protein Tco_0395024, partial [Tanacetum coccineum]